MPSDKIRTELVENLLEALARMKDTDSIYALLEDLCTVREITEMSQRLQAADMLSQGASYIDIQKATGMSATTVSRVSKCLNYGSGGYRAALDVLGRTQEGE